MDIICPHCEIILDSRDVKTQIKYNKIKASVATSNALLVARPIYVIP